MGTLGAKLNKVLTTKSAIRAAIIQKGVSVPANTKFSLYPSLINSITTGTTGTGGSGGNNGSGTNQGFLTNVDGGSSASKYLSFQKFNGEDAYATGSIKLIDGGSAWLI